MPYIITTDRPIYWGVGNPIVASGLTEIGGLTVTGLTMYSDKDENVFLGQVAGKGGTYNPLPVVGEWVEMDVIYSYGTELLICRQSHFRTQFEPADTPALFIVYRVEQTGALQWIVGEQVQIGTHRIYDGVEYACLQAHVTQSDWTPPVVPALWQIYVATPPVSEWTPGTYAIDVFVTHNSRTWKSLMNGNAYEPGVVGTWRDQSDPPLWVAPAGSVGLWQVGDIVEYNGHRWQCTSPNNAFAPGVFGWTDLGLL